MTHEETIEGNRLIAEFMGGKFEKREVFIGLIEEAAIIKAKINGLIHTKDWIPLSRMEYHSSWDWLMPVFEKIRDYGYTNEIKSTIGHSNQVTIYIGSENKPIRINEWNNRINQITCAFMAVVEFIKWFNKNKQNG